MTTNDAELAGLAGEPKRKAGARGAAGAGRRAAEVEALIAKIKDKDDKVRSEAWLGAGAIGAPAVASLAQVMADGELEVARAAKNALWKIVHTAGRPGAPERQKQGVVRRLIALLEPAHADAVRREVLWMLSEIAGDEAVEPIAALISDKTLREDARMVLDRIPGDASLAALKAALDKVPEAFKINIAQSLRHRGVVVAGLPCQKLVPTKKTYVVPVK
ncbi:MAG: hypothetical protein JXP34_22010 [Planctomycetes bacterium]|nr:hypothetical protein [Planctomycetota bacterium]